MRSLFCLLEEKEEGDKNRREKSNRNLILRSNLSQEAQTMVELLTDINLKFSTRTAVDTFTKCEEMILLFHGNNILDRFLWKS